MRAAGEKRRRSEIEMVRLPAGLLFAVVARKIKIIAPPAGAIYSHSRRRSIERIELEIF